MAGVREGGPPRRTRGLTQRDDLWQDRSCQAVVDRMQGDGVWAPLDLTGPAPYLPEGYGGTPAVACYYLTALVS